MSVTQTDSGEYANRLLSIESRWWRRFIDVQAPYRYNIRRLGLGFTLDVGAGIGRNLIHLEGEGVGIDHNRDSVAKMRERGLTAFHTDEFLQSAYAVPGRFDSLLFAHVLEHVDAPLAETLLRFHLKFVKPGGKVVVITPQEAGYRSDASHVCFVDATRSREILQSAGLTVDKSYSFPFPRLVGRFFPHNEFVVVAHT